MLPDSELGSSYFSLLPIKCIKLCVEQISFLMFGMKKQTKRSIVVVVKEIVIGGVVSVVSRNI